MRVQLFVFILSVLAAFAGIFSLLWLMCQVLDHDWLVMLHMYFTPIILSVALGIVLILTSNRRMLVRRKRAPGNHPVER